MFDEQFIKIQGPDMVYKSYFVELGKMVSASEVDIVAHVYIPTRTAQALFGYDPQKYEIGSGESSTSLSNEIWFWK